MDKSNNIYENNEGKPLVSVLMTAYNREKYIEEAIQSVLDSYYINFELIIVDDGSTDKSFEIAKACELKDKRINVYRNENNLGQFENRNKAAYLAKGKYIKYVDSDDKISPGTLCMMVEAMERDLSAGIGLVCNSLEKIEGKAYPYKYLDSRTALLWHYCNGGLLFPGPTGCIFRRELFIREGSFPLDLGINGDIFLNLKIAAISNVALFPPDIVFWRKHPDQVDELQQDFYKMHKERFIIHQKILAQNNLPIRAKQLKRIKLSGKILFMRGVFFKYFLKGNFKRGLELLKDVNISVLSLPFIFLPLRTINNYKMIAR